MNRKIEKRIRKKGKKKKIMFEHFSLSGYNDFDDAPSESNNVIYCKPGKKNQKICKIWYTVYMRN
ncbi:MAG: hypothetical protein KH296_12290 [Ruminococcus sp.]|nr:hypothetical protein [Ruminococcus sp.]